MKGVPTWVSPKVEHLVRVLQGAGVYEEAQEPLLLTCYPQTHRRSNIPTAQPFVPRFNAPSTVWRRRYRRPQRTLDHQLLGMGPNLPIHGLWVGLGLGSIPLRPCARACHFECWIVFAEWVRAMTSLAPEAWSVFGLVAVHNCFEGHSVARLHGLPCWRKLGGPEAACTEAPDWQ